MKHEVTLNPDPNDHLPFCGLTVDCQEKDSWPTGSYQRVCSRCFRECSCHLFKYYATKGLRELRFKVMGIGPELYEVDLKRIYELIDESLQQWD